MRKFIGKLLTGSETSGEGPGSGSYYYDRPPQDYHNINYEQQRQYSPQPSPRFSRNNSFQNPRPYVEVRAAYQTDPIPQHNVLQKASTMIPDNYTSLHQVTEALAQAGLESSNLIVGIDFTKSNTWTGKKSFKGLSLHHIGDLQNPYEHAISIIGRTLSTFDEDNLIPCFGFGDAKTHDKHVFNFYPDGRPCDGFEEALSRYREIAPNIQLSGPTSFAPIIEMAMTIVEQSSGQYHVLLIIADGQVTGNGQKNQLSYQEQKTIEAIVEASRYALSIVLVGVGDGPWDMMKEFDDNIPQRAFDNFQFVNFTEVMQKNTSQSKKETEFALAALMEIPAQYKATLELGILGRQTGSFPERVALPPPILSQASASFRQRASQPTSSRSTVTSNSNYTSARPPPTTSNSSNTFWDNQLCAVCLSNNKNMAFGCGHQTCVDCGMYLESCPICRAHIETRIRLY